MKTFKEIYFSELGIQIAFFLGIGVILVTFTAMAVAKIPAAGNLWLALLVSLTLPGFGIVLLAQSIRQFRRGDSHSDGSID